MYLHTLKMSAVGPFAGDEEIDFAELAATNLFLLEGPTGVGKSTIIDAIVYALYGSVAGSGASVERMRSELASPNTPTSVELTFETQVGTFRVVRTPAYDRSKLRGDGLVAQAATVKLFRLGSPDSTDGQLISNRHEEANQEIVHAIGLTKTQFTQTIVLPQGEFAEFLKAKPEERRGVLQRIFGTQLYEDISRELVVQRQRAQRQRDDAQRAIEDELHVFTEVAACSDEESEQLTRPVGSADIEGWATQVHERVSQAHQQLADSFADAQRIHSQASIALKTAERQELLFTRRDELLRERTELLDQEPAIADLTSRCSRLRDAATCSDVLDKLQDARSLVSTNRAELDQQAQRLRSDPLTSAAIDEPNTAAQELRRVAAQLEAAVTLEEKLPDSRHLIEELAGQKAAHAQSLKVLAAALVEIPREAAQLNQRLTEQHAASARLSDLKRKVADLRDRVDASEAAATAQAALNTLADSLTARRAAAATAAAQVTSLTNRWIDGMAGQLAGELEPDVPCMVCGSKEHPQPAVPSSTAVSQRDVEDASALHSAAVEQYADLEARYNDANLEHKHLTTKAAGAEPSVARAHYQEAVDELTALEEAANSVATTEAELGRLAGSERSSTKQQDQLLVSLSAVSERLDAATQQLGRDEELVTTSRAQWPSVSDRVRDLTSSAKAVDQFASTTSEVRACEQRLLERAQDFAEALERSGLKSEQEVEALLPAVAELSELEERIHEYGVRVATNARRLAEPDLAALDDTGRPQTSQLGEDLTRADAAVKQATEAAANALKQLTDTGIHRSELLARHRFLAETLESTGPILRVADVANANSSDNLQRITLAAFVLIDRFQRVVNAANAHLKHISDGQYQLERSEQPESNGRKSGLGLNMRDEHTGHLRSPRDLSGGETFYTSLALALGLADIVTSETGGVELGTLFIDEGFGTLDPERLEAVLSEIAKQQNSGRVVGVVSHVEDLKIRIQHRIAVRRTASGASTLEVVG